MALQFDGGSMTVSSESYAKDIRVTVYIDGKAGTYFSFKIPPMVAIALSKTLEYETKKLGVECALLSAGDAQQAEEVPF